MDGHIDASRVGRLFRDLASELEAMEAKGKVDTVIVSRIDAIIEGLSTLEERWIGDREVDVRDAFVMYHSLRLTHVVGDQLKQSILTAEKTKDNPLVVEQALKILPMLIDIQETVTKFLAGRIPKGARNAIHNKARELRDLAEDLGLYPSFEEETKGFDERKLIRHVEQVASKVAEEFEEQSSS